MKSYDYDFAILGGDLRQSYLAGLLSEAGYRVCSWALTAPPVVSIDSCASPKEAVRRARYLAGPIPFWKETPVREAVLEAMEPGQCLFAGCIPDSFALPASRKGCRLYDLMDDPILAWFNTVATAEGAVAEAIAGSPRNLAKSRCLILGWGKCAKALCPRLKGLFCHVAVCARNAAARAQAETAADEALSFRGLEKRIGDFDFLFNTVPHLVLTEPLLQNTKPDALLIDLASAPGGTDFPAAARLGRKVMLCQGLPGKYAPASSAGAIREAIFRCVSPNVSEAAPVSMLFSPSART